MGSDFSALIKCPPLSGMEDPRIASIESCSTSAMRAIGQLWRESGFAVRNAEQGWVNNDGFPELVPRPDTLSLLLSYCTKEEFYLTFGLDVVGVYHVLRLHTFLTSAEWKLAMVDACRSLAELMNATDGLITRDESPVMFGFYAGHSYEACLKLGTGDCGEVATVDQLYERIDDRGTWDSHAYWRFLRDGNYCSVVI